MLILKTPIARGQILTVVSSLTEALNMVTSRECKLYKSDSDVPRVGDALVALVAELEAAGKGISIAKFLAI